MNAVMKILCFCGSTALITSYAFAQTNEIEFAKAIEKYLQTEAGQDAIGKAAETYFKRMEETARQRQARAQEIELEEQFKNPVKIEIGNSPVKGPKDAKVTIIEFSDYQCPYCKRGKDVMAAIAKAYPNDVKIAFKNLPLAFHQEAGSAAKAALAAGKQNKFWEMHDLLFDNQSQLGQTFYEKSAADLGLNVEKFKKDMISAEIEKQIEEDTQLAQKHGIGGTPGFFVNGVAVRGAYPLEHFKMIIDRWLQQK